MESHNLLCDLAIALQLYFGYIIGFIFTVNFLQIVLEFYYFLEVIFIPEEYFKNLDTVQLVALVLSPTIVACLQLLGIVEMCECTVAENKKISNHLFKLLNLNVNEDLEDRLNLFVIQCGNRPIEFSGAGVFKVNRKIYLTVSPLKLII